MFSFLLSILATASDPLTSLERDCTAGKPLACRQLGAAHLARNRGDARPAYSAWATGCRLGDAPSCNEAGTLLWQGTGVARDLEEGVRLLRVGCERQHALSCLTLASALARMDQDDQPPLKRAFDLTRSACEGGDAEACRVHLRSAQAQTPPALNVPQQVKLTTRVCNAGANWACGELAVRYWGGTGVPRDLEQARRLATSACAGRDGTGCMALTRLAMDEKRYDEAYKAASVGCQEANAGACQFLGVLLLEGKGVAAQPAAGARHIEQACHLGAAGSCEALFSWAPLKNDAARAERAASEGCALGSPPACRRVLARKPEPTGDQRLQALDVVCRDRDGSACEQMAELLEPAAAGPYLAAACELGRTATCAPALRLAATPETRRPLLAKACVARDVDACAQLAADKAVTAEGRFEALATVCAARQGPACDDVAAMTQQVPAEKRLSAAFSLDDGCDASHLVVCRTITRLATGTTRESPHELADQVLCEASDDAAACQRLVDDEPDSKQAAWAQAMQCRRGFASACAALRSVAATELSSLRGKPRDVILDRISVIGLVIGLGPLPPASVPTFRCAVRDQYGCGGDAERKERVQRWFSALPLQARLKEAREQRLCAALRDIGVSGELLSLPVDTEVYGGTSVSLDDVSELELHKSGQRISACAEAWAVENQDGEEIASGQLTVREDYRGFHPIQWGTAPPVVYQPEFPLSAGLEVLAGAPRPGEDFLTGSGTLRVRIDVERNTPASFAARIGLTLPLGGRNGFGLHMGLGGYFGLLHTSSIKWRVLTAMLEVWYFFEPKLEMALAPALGTQLGVSLGRHEFTLELGARFPAPLTSGAGRLPDMLQLVPHAALIYRPGLRRPEASP
jgi:TPR repeat protein